LCSFTYEKGVLQFYFVKIRLLDRISPAIVCPLLVKFSPETKMRENLRTPLPVTNLIENLFVVVGILCGRSP
jgi:hypothetical protein